MYSGQEYYNYQNQQRAKFIGAGKYDIPQILSVRQDIDLSAYRWISFNYALTEKHPEECVCHFFIYDYQFERLWNSPDKYIRLFKRFKAITTPDFSLYTDYPRALQIYNHFRKHWLGAYYQMHGITVFPTINWSDDESFDFCLDGEPHKAPVVMCDIAVNDDSILFNNGYCKTIDKLSPSIIYMYGFSQEKNEPAKYIAQSNYYNIKRIESMQMQEMRARCL